MISWLICLWKGHALGHWGVSGKRSMYWYADCHRCGKIIYEKMLS